jgi:hypothetical protein
MELRFGLPKVGSEAAELGLVACVEVEEALGWSAKVHFSEAEFQTWFLKACERAEELRLEIFDASKRPSFAAVRQAIRDCIFSGQRFKAMTEDRAWFSKNSDHRILARGPLPHEAQPHSAKYRQKAIVVRDQNGEPKDYYYPLLLLITHVNHSVDWTNETEIIQLIDCSNREIASLH